MTRTRVCIVNPFQHGGGAEFQISLLTAALHAANRFDVWYLTHHVAPEIQPNGYEIVRIGDDDRVPRLGYVTDFVPLYRALRSLKPHVIYQRVACGYTGICAFYTRQHHRLTRMIWHVAHTTDVTRESLDTVETYCGAGLRNAVLNMASAERTGSWYRPTTRTDC